jgi:hypothetical protein
MDHNVITRDPAWEEIRVYEHAGNLCYFRFRGIGDEDGPDGKQLA